MVSWVMWNYNFLSPLHSNHFSDFDCFHNIPRHWQNIPSSSTHLYLHSYCVEISTTALVWEKWNPYATTQYWLYVNKKWLGILYLHICNVTNFKCNVTNIHTIFCWQLQPEQSSISETHLETTAGKLNYHS